MGKINLTIDANIQIDFLKDDGTTVTGSDIIHFHNIKRIRAAGTGWWIDHIREDAHNKQFFLTDIVNLNGSAIGATTYAEVTALLLKTGAALALISSAQNLTGTWADLGSEIRTAGANKLALWLTVDINLSNNVRVRGLAKHASAGSEEYDFPISTVNPSYIGIVPEYVEFENDSDQLMIIKFSLDEVIPYTQIQVMAGTPGVSPGQIDAAYITIN